MDVTYGGAFIAGAVSFLSPCVLPLIPPYLCFLGGVTLDQMTGGEAAEQGVTGRVFRAALAFVLGFTTVFVGLGLTASLLGRFISDHFETLGVIAGVIISVLGLHFLGLFRIGFLMRDARFHLDAKPAGLLGAYLIGLAFAFGWTPCVGPVLAAILVVAGAEGAPLEGAGLLATYSLGLGLLFLSAALFVKPFMTFMTRFRRHMGKVEKVMGGALVLTGVLFVTGGVNDIGFWLLETFPSLGKLS